MKKLLKILAGLVILIVAYLGYDHLIQRNQSLNALELAINLQPNAWSSEKNRNSIDWESIEYLSDHPDIQAFSHDYIIGVYEQALQDKKLKIRTSIINPITLLSRRMSEWEQGLALSSGKKRRSKSAPLKTKAEKSGPPWLDENLNTSLIGLCLLSGECFDNYSNEPVLATTPHGLYSWFFDDFKSNPIVTAAFEKFIILLPHSKTMLSNSQFAAFLKGFSKRQSSHNADVLQAAIQYSVKANFDEVTILALQEALNNFATATLRGDAWQEVFTRIYRNKLEVKHDQHAAKLSTEYKARHILVKTEEDAKKIIDELLAGSDFIKLAKAKSIGSSKLLGGELGWFTAAKMVAPFSKATIALEKGQYTTVPVQTPFGWHIILKEGTRTRKQTLNLGGINSPVFGLLITDLIKAKTKIKQSFYPVLLEICQTPEDSIAVACIDLLLSYPSLIENLAQSAKQNGIKLHQVSAQILANKLLAVQSRSPQTILAEWMQSTPTEPNNHQIGQDRVYSFMDYTPNSRRFKRDLKALVAADTVTSTPFYLGLRSKNRAVIRLSINYLISHDLEGFSQALIKYMDLFQPLAWSYITANVALPSYTRLADLEIDHQAFFYYGMRITESLIELQELPLSPAMIYPWIRSLSLPEPGLSTWAARFLRKRLNANEFADALFSYLAVRKEFLVSEVNIYKDTLSSYPEASTAIERNLISLMQKYKRLRAIPWIHKVIAIKALSEIGKPSAIKLLQFYQKDKGHYISFNSDLKSGASQNREKVAFADIALKATNKIQLRQKKNN